MFNSARKLFKKRRASIILSLARVSEHVKLEVVRMRFLMWILVALFLLTLTACPKKDDGAAATKKADPTAAAGDESEY